MDRRHSFRHSVNESVEVQVRLLDTPRAVAMGCIDNISDDGMRLTLNDCLPLGSWIEVECEDWALRGTVMYNCESKRCGRDAEYICGIRMEHLA